MYEITLNSSNCFSNCFSNDNGNYFSNYFGWEGVLHTPPTFFYNISLLLQPCLLITRCYFFCLLCLWFHFWLHLKLRNDRRRCKKTLNNWQMLQDRKMEPRTKVLKIFLMRRSSWKFNLAAESWTAISLHIETQYKTCISKFIKLLFVFQIWDYIVVFVHICLCRSKIPTGPLQTQPFADVR